MKSRKTPQKERGTYTYHFDDGRSVTIKPGEEGVTEEIIKKLHSLDDSEVYYNNKNWHRPISDEERQAIKEWEEQHPGEKYPEVWNISLDSIYEEDGNQDKSILLADTSTIDEEVSDDVEELRAVVSKMTERQRQVYVLLFIEEYSLTEVAEKLNISIPVVSRHRDKVLKFIKENFKRG